MDWQEKAYQTLSSMYPEAKVEKKDVWERQHNYSKPDGGREVKVVVVTFPNGFEVQYKFSRPIKDSEEEVYVYKNKVESWGKLAWDDIVNVVSKLQPKQEA